MCEKDNVFKNRVSQYFGDKILEDKSIRDTLISFEELLNIKKNIRNMFNTDDPMKIKSFIGKKINNVLVTQKDFEYSFLIFNKYNELYLKCKKLLKKCESK